MTKKTSVRTPSSTPPATAASSDALTIRRTLADHERDPRHHFHPRGHLPDGRATVAAGERLQRVRSRAQAN